MKKRKYEIAETGYNASLDFMDSKNLTTRAFFTKTFLLASRYAFEKELAALKDGNNESNVGDYDILLRYVYHPDYHDKLITSIDQKTVRLLQRNNNIISNILGKLTSLVKYRNDKHDGVIEYFWKLLSTLYNDLEKNNKKHIYTQIDEIKKLLKSICLKDEKTACWEYFETGMDNQFKELNDLEKKEKIGMHIKICMIFF